MAKSRLSAVRELEPELVPNLSRREGMSGLAEQVLLATECAEEALRANPPVDKPSHGPGCYVLAEEKRREQAAEAVCRVLLRRLTGGDR